MAANLQLHKERDDEEWLSPYLPLEDKVANYSPRRMQGTIIRVTGAG